MSELDQAAIPIVLAFDVGGTRLKAGIVQGEKIFTLRVEPLELYRNVSDLLAQLVRVGRQLLVDYTVTAIGISVKGIVDPCSGVILDVNERLEACINEPLTDLVAQAFGLPTVIENDARMYTLGELLYGAGRAVNNMVCLTLGTGIGSGVAWNRRVLRGCRGVSGILGGHITIQMDGPLCSCGNRGCLEALIGTTALIREVKQILATGRDSSLRDGSITPVRIFAASAAGDSLARELVQQFAERLGAGIVSLIHVYDPDLVVLGGGMMKASHQFLPAIQTYVSQHAWTLPRKRVGVTAAELGDASALVGIASIACGSEYML